MVCATGLLLQRSREPVRGRSRKKRIEVVDKDMAHLHIRPSDAMDCSKWTDSTSDSDVESCLRIVCLWFRLSQVDLD